jgi:hypothetical protein
MKKLLLCCLFLSSILHAQQKYIVTPEQQFIPITPKGISAVAEIARRLQTEMNALSDCNNQMRAGYAPDLYPPVGAYSVRHKDAIGQWYVAKASGNIDTVYWLTGLQIGAYDSSATFRFSPSNIGPDYGPGVRDYVHGVNFPPPCQSWGFWLNANDNDRHVSAYPEEATDSTWYSTIYNAPMPTRPPIGYDPVRTWATPVTLHPGKTDHFAFADIGMPCEVAVGEKFFLSLQVDATGHVPFDRPTQFYAWSAHVTNSDENYPSRDWVFFEHDSMAFNCAGNPIANTKRGWYALGSGSQDTLDVAAFNIWYTMTATTNTPPEITDLPDGSGIPGSTLSTDPITVSENIRDCDPTVAGNMGAIANAYIQWSTTATGVNQLFTPQPDLLTTSSTPPLYLGQIPGQVAGTTVSWRVKAIDNKGFIAYGPPHSYRVTTLRNQYYQADTGTISQNKSIAGSAAALDPSQFFVPNRFFEFFSGAGSGGTAGPFDLGRTMKYFGSDVRYVWVGVCGAIALSNSPTDTIDVNANGFYTNAWDMPGLQRMGRADTNNLYRMPRNFIAPCWANLRYFDQSSITGAIRVGHPEGDTCLFVVEWDSIGVVDNNTGNLLPHSATFRVILNACLNSVEFQWDNVSASGIDKNALIGLEASADSATLAAPNPPFFYVSKNGTPSDLAAKNSHAVAFYPVGKLTTDPGWNLFSIPGLTKPMSVSEHFGPGAKIFGYSHGKYFIADSLVSERGYWVKYSSGGNGMVFGQPLTTMSVPVEEGWNMIGSLVTPAYTSEIDTAVNTSIRSHFFSYNLGYKLGATIVPGKGYFVKVHLLNGDTLGHITLHAPLQAQKSVSQHREFESDQIQSFEKPAGVRKKD